MTDKTTIDLSERQVKVTNLNFSPEKAGNELVERVDMSLEVLLEEEDLGMFLPTTCDNPRGMLWDPKGYPALLTVKKVPLDLKVAGLASLSLVRTNADGGSFEGATLKKCVLEPMIETRATLSCQVRVDPTGWLEDLGVMRIEQQAIFSFKGEGETEEDDGQDELEV